MPFIRSSIGKKILMGFTGLFLCSFLVIHLSGNFQLLKSDSGLQFNIYTKFMTTNGLIRFLEIGLLLGFLIHIADGIRLTMENRKARPVDYEMNKPAGKSTIASRNMGLTGAVVLIFLVIHLKNFWYEFHWGEIALDANGNKDMYAVTLAAFHNVWYIIIYLVALYLLAFHLNHGFQSAFQSLGVNHKTLSPAIHHVGIWFSILVSLGFAVFPVYFYFFK